MSARTGDGKAVQTRAINMTKVLHIITRLDHGGSATNTIASVDLLRKHGFDTALAYGATGLLVPKNDVDACSRALVQLEDKTLRTEMGRKATDSVYPEYDEGSMIQQLAKFYGEFV
jgi:glycosyltransferase involved in cell wall biosynthesis